jgi:tagatose-6-phosphate ketose/aldose isomerase
MSIARSTEGSIHGGGPELGGAEATTREIGQQPAVWREVVRASAERRAQCEAFLAPVLNLPAARIVLSGAGTSAFAGSVLAPALTASLRRRVDAIATTDIVSSPHDAFAEDVPTVLVSLARSGESPESIAATDLADESLHLVRHLVVTCNPFGRLARNHAASPTSLVLLMPEETNDRGFAMTSSFTSMILATWLALNPSGLSAEDVERIANAAEDLLTGRADEIARLAAAGYERVVYLGSGLFAALARESALKLLELTAGAVVSYFDSSLGFRHGPKSVLREGTLAVVYLSNDSYTRRYDEDIVDELCAALGDEHVIVVTARPSERETDRRVWRLNGLDDVRDIALALPFVVVAQLLALHMSLSLGYAPDNPFPTGEVNRVVKGVTVHRMDHA